MPTDRTPSVGSTFSRWIVVTLVLVVGLQVAQSWQLRGALRRSDDALRLLDDTAARLEKAAIETEKLERQIEIANDRLAKLDEHARHQTKMADEWELLIDDVEQVKGRVDDLVVAFENRGPDGGMSGPPQPPELDWTEPSLFAAAQRAGATVGIELTADEVRVPARIVLRAGSLEYFAVLKGGKEHESLLSLVGNAEPRERRPKEFAAKLNNAIQALGLKRGSPIRFSPNGTRPAEGQPVYLFVEWQADGKTVSARAEDLVWDRVKGAPMPHDSWVFVGSSWIEGDNAGEMIFAADLTAEAVATYSSVNTIIDTIAPGAQDDTVYLVASPRLPAGVTDVTLVIRKDDKEPTITFPPPDESGDDAGTPPKDDE